MAKRTNDQPAFSQQIQEWLQNGKNISFDGLIAVFEEKAFAIVFLLMMALPALPIPTGGLTHLTEIITAMGALQMLAGRRRPWIPEWARRRVDVAKLMSGKGGEKLIAVIKWFERWSRRRGSYLLVQKPFISLIGLIVLIFTVAAFVAPPFSGLDTLPALGVVIISLAIILEDITILGIGIGAGLLGIAIEIFIGGAIFHSLGLVV